MYPQYLEQTGFPWSFVLPEHAQNIDCKRINYNLNHQKSYFTPTVILNPLYMDSISSISECPSLKKINVFQECETFSKDDDYQP